MPRVYDDGFHRTFENINGGRIVTAPCFRCQRRNRVYSAGDVAIAVGQSTRSNRLSSRLRKAMTSRRHTKITSFGERAARAVWGLPHGYAYWLVTEQGLNRLYLIIRPEISEYPTGHVKLFGLPVEVTDEVRSDEARLLCGNYQAILEIP